MRRRLRSVALLLGFAVLRVTAQEAPLDPTLTITVVDPTGARIPHARVLVVRSDGTEVTSSSSTVSTSVPAVSMATSWTSRLPPGAYAITVDAEGFVSRTLRPVRLRAGESRRLRVSMSLAPLVASVDVERHPMEAATDPRGFTTVLTPQQIEALPDDPDELVRVLRDLAPPGAILRIDGFTGGVIPPKSQILSIRIPRLDTFAAQEHGGLTAASAIEIVTRPGGVWQAGVDTVMRHGRLSARHALAAERTPESQWATGVAVDGPLLPRRASFGVAIRTARRRETATMHAVLPDGAIYRASIARPVEAHNLNARATLLLPSDRTIRVGYSADTSQSRRLGIGEQNLPARGYTLRSSAHSVRAASGGAWGRTAFIESRMQLRWSGSRTQSDEERPTIRVLDAFTDGGAQVTGGARAFELQLASDVDYAVASHALRSGVLVDNGRYRVRRPSNYLGTFTFDSLSAFAAGTPSFFTQRLGPAAVRYDDRQVSAYLQDDHRLGRGLLLSYGVRYEWQNLLPSSAAWLPRLSFTWAPQPSGRTTIRVSAGRFSEWMAANIHEQQLLVDGTRQWDVRVATPSYPATDGPSMAAVRERLAVAADARRAVTDAFGVAVEHQLSPLVRLTASMTLREGRHLLRGRNRNPVIDGRRPSPSEGNVIEAVSDGALQGRSLTAQAIMASRRRAFDLAATYMWNGTTVNASGPFAPPAVADDLSTEWGAIGPAHALTAAVGIRWRSFTVSMTPRWRSGTPYSVIAGDLNGDGLYLERPDGVPRAGARTPSQAELSIRLARSWPFGVSAASQPQDRVELFASAQNLFNRPNYLAFGNLIGSPLFGRPLVAGPPRTIDLGIRVSF